MAIQPTPKTYATLDAVLAPLPFPAPRRLPTRTVAAIPTAKGPVRKVQLQRLRSTVCASMGTVPNVAAMQYVMSKDAAWAQGMHSKVSAVGPWRE